MPEAGLYAGETVDVEFRVADTAHRDPIEGLAGVPMANPTASVTMPEMAGMPVQRPAIHREGVPGDYGLELYFPHGGAYKIGLRLAPTGGSPAYATFRVDVADADAKRAPSVAPFRVVLLDPPKTAGPATLHLAIQDARSGETVRAFDVAHTKLIHLVLASEDLGWFAHEHPVQRPDGTFVWKGAFPAGGDYLVFADVAPKDRGSQVLGTTLRLSGPAPTWSKALRPSRHAVVDGLDATLDPEAFPVGRTVPLVFRLRDARTHRPVADLQPYLGANGHLMIVHRDGASFVHSHPADDAVALALARRGVVRFNARFPRPGLYKAWAQFQRHGRVVTLPFVFPVG